MILSKKQVKTIEWHLERYKELKKYVDSVRDEIINSSPNMYGEVGGKSNIHSDSTALKAIKLCDTTEEEKWVLVIEKTLQKLDESGNGLNEFLEKRYFEKKNIIKVMMELNIERTTAYRWREEIILSTAIYAVQEGLLRL